jgi:hypothetical protein
MLEVTHSCLQLLVYYAVHLRMERKGGSFVAEMSVYFAE